MTNQRPYVIMNAATTADGKTDTIARRGATISSPLDLERVDRLRAESDAVMVGGKTLMGDDPRLTVKSVKLRAERLARGQLENPIKVGVISEANLRLESRFINSNSARVMLFTTLRSSASQIERLRGRGVEVFVMGERQVDLIATLDHLKKDGVDRLLVEGGGTLNMALLQLKQVDEIHIYVAPLLFGGITAPTFADGNGLIQDAAIHLQLSGVETLADSGFVVHYRLPKDRVNG